MGKQRTAISFLFFKEGHQIPRPSLEKGGEAGGNQLVKSNLTKHYCFTAMILTDQNHCYERLPAVPPATLPIPEDTLDKYHKMVSYISHDMDSEHQEKSDQKSCQAA